MKIAYVNLDVFDLERSVAFYTEKLGLELLFQDVDHGYASLHAGSISLGLAVVGDDLEAEHARLEALGVAFAMPPERQPWGGFMAVMADPDGNTLYLDEVSAVHGSDDPGQ